MYVMRRGRGEGGGGGGGGLIFGILRFSGLSSFSYSHGHYVCHLGINEHL